MEVALFLVSLCLVVVVVVDGQKSVRRTAYTHQEEMKVEQMDLLLKLKMSSDLLSGSRPTFWNFQVIWIT